MVSKKKKKPHTIFLSILGYKEDGDFVALCLEMDLRGWGDSFEEAEEELIGMINAQISFAIQENDLSLLDHPAEEKYWHLFKEHQQRSLHHILDDTDERDSLVDVLSFSADSVPTKPTFVRVA